MAFGFSKFLRGINLSPNSASKVSQLGDLDSTTNGRLNFYNGSSVSVIVTTSSTDVLTNKSIDANHNTITNLTDSNFSSAATIPRTRIAAGTANQIVVNDDSGNLSSEAQISKLQGGTGADNTNVTFPSTGVIVTETGTETLTNKTLTTPNSDIINFAQLTLNPATPSSGDRKLFTKSDGVYQIDDSGTVTKFATGSSSGDINNGGNTFGSNITIGTNDNFNLGFKVNNIVKYNIPASTGLLTAPSSNTAAVTAVGLVGGAGSSGNTNGGVLTLSSGAGVGSGNGGATTVISGSANGSGGTGGALSLSAGAGQVSGSAGGNLALGSGSAGGGSSNAGDVSITGGNAGGSGTGGTITLRGGNSNSGTSGSILLEGGNSGGVPALTIDANNSVIAATTALSTAATSGYTSITSTSGTPFQVPSGFGQAIPLTYDSTTDSICAYSSGWKRIETIKLQFNAGSSGTTPSIDFNNSPAQLMTLSNDAVLTLSNAISGQAYVIKIIQGSTPFTLTWPSNVKWPGGTAPTISTASGAIDLINLYYDGTNYLGSFAQAYA